MTDQNQKKRTGMASLAAAGEGEDFSVIDAIGGPRGVIESMLPGVLFVVLFVVTSNLNLTIGVSAALAVLQVVIRLVQRQSVMGALSGLIAVGICLIWAWQSHEARNYYMFGFLTNAVYIVLLSFTLLIRVPGLGLMVEFIRTIPTEHFRAWLHGWLDDKPLRRAAVPRRFRGAAGHGAPADGHTVLGAGDMGVVSDHRHPAAPAHRRGQSGGRRRQRR